MKFLYMVGLTELEISEVVKSPIKVAENTFITNDTKFIKSLIPSRHIPVIGHLEYGFLTSGRPVIYKTGDVLVNEAALVEVVNLLREAHAILTSLWMNQDCSVNCDTGFALGINSEHVHTNTLNLHYSFANGEKKQLTINLAELEASCALAVKTFKGLKEQNKPQYTAMQKTTGRINISTYHLQMARSADDLAIKVSTYCSFFEALFSTNTAELSHQLSERIAFSLSDSPHERLDIFKKIKKAYGIRSKTVHGDIIPAKELKDLINIAESCDEIARKVYYKIISSPEVCKLFEGTNEQIDNHMRELIFGLKAKF